MSLVDRTRLLLTEFAEEFGLPEPPLEDGHCCIVIDDTVVVHLDVEEENGHVTLYSVVGEFEEEPPLPVLERLFAANLGWFETDGATLALNELSDEVILQHTFDVDGLAYPAFRDVLERLVNSAEEWTRELARPAAGQPAPMAPPPAIPASFA